MSLVRTTCIWLAIAGIGAGMGAALYEVSSPDFNAVVLAAFAIFLSLTTSLAFQKIRKFDDLGNVGWLDSVRRDKIRRLADKRRRLLSVRWRLVLISGLIAGLCAGLLKVPSLPVAAFWWITIVGFASSSVLLCLTVLMNHEFNWLSRTQTEITYLKEENERKRAFQEKVKA